MSSRVLIRLHPGSDGDVLHIPKTGIHTQVDPGIYLEKLGQQWMETRGDARPGLHYVLESLPAGYTVWGRPRPGNPSHIDRYLFGHPEHKTFDSPNRFYPHFQHLMDNQGSNIGCPCTVCLGGSGYLPPKPSAVHRKASIASRCLSSGTLYVVGNNGHSSQAAAASAAPVHVKGPQKTTKAGMDMSKIDEEGTPDVYRNLVDKLRRHTTVDEVIEEPLSPDWRAEQQLLPELLQDIKAKQQSHPRVGDIVLFVRNMPSDTEIVRHYETGQYQMYDRKTKQYMDTPLWEAGLVGQSNTSAINVNKDGEDNTSLSLSGIRVEPLPNVNDVDKSISKRHKYVSLRQLRPFTLWRELLRGCPQEDWHPTILNALTIASTVSLFGKQRFKGTWPDANVYCHGLYVGFEMLAVGDTVRLRPNPKINQIECHDILVIRSIRLRWSNLDKASSNDYDEGRSYNSEIRVYGAAYTQDASRSDKCWLSSSTSQLDKNPPKAADGYGAWHPLHPPDKELAVPHSRILSRLYERSTLSQYLWSFATTAQLLDAGRVGLVEARKYAGKHDERIADGDGTTWYWGDSRGEALGLRMVNGLDLARYDQERDVKDLRRGLKILDAMADDVQPSGPSSRAPGAHGRDLRVFTAPGTAALPMRSQRGQASGSASLGAGGTGQLGIKRPHVVHLEDDLGTARRTTRVFRR